MLRKVIIPEEQLKKILNRTASIPKIAGVAIAEDCEGNDILKIRFADGNTSVVPVTGLCEDCIRADILTGIVILATNKEPFFTLMEQVDEWSSLISARLKKVYGYEEDEAEAENSEDECDEDDNDICDWEDWLASQE